MISLENLNYTAGIESNFDRTGYGAGKQFGSEAWKKTYDNIMNSNESVSFYLVAAQSHLDSIVANDFALKTGLESALKEEKILKMITPLSRENSNVYGQILNVLQVKSMENVIDKAKDFGKKAWEVIKQAFKRLKLVFTNIIQGIRKALASFFNGGDTDELLKKWDKITSNAAKSSKSIKVSAFSTKRWLKLDDLNKFSMAIRMSGNNMNKAADKLTAKLNSSDTDIQESEIQNALKSSVSDIARFGIDGFNYSSGHDAGVTKKDATSVIKMVLYGTKKVMSYDIPIKTIIEHKSIKYILSNDTVKDIKQISNEMDNSVKAINKILSAIEKIESGRKVDKDDEKSVNTKNRKIKYIRIIRQRMTDFSIMGKDVFIEFIKIRKTAIRAAKIALGDKADDKKKI